MNIMQYIKGYRFNTLEEADLVVSQLNKYYGLPVPGGLSYFNNDAYSLIEDFYFFNEHEMLVPVLGEPNEYEIN